jgi:hypothetical protein
MKKLRYLHIPKTAGSTFANILKNQYGAGRTFEFEGRFESDRQRYLAIPTEDRNKISLYVGHAPIYTSIPEIDSVEIITMLRDPVARVKSFCQHVSEGKSEHLVDRFPPKRFNLDEFLDSGDEELSNVLAKMLINNQTCVDSDYLSSLTPAEAVDLAMDNLLHTISCFGLQEYFDESLVIFAKRFGWKIPTYVSLNKKNRRVALKFEDRHIRKIWELNPISMEIYRRAKQHFEGMLSSDLFDADELNRLRRFNNPIGRTFLRVFHS